MAINIYLYIFITYLNNRARIEELWIDLNLSILNGGSHTYTSRTHVSSTTSDISLSSTYMRKDCNWTTLRDSGSDHIRVRIRG